MNRSLYDEIYISVVIPAYNEEGVIEETLLSLHDYFSEQNYTHEIIVVNDGSDDRTAQAVAYLTDAMPELALINLSKNGGKGAAVREGMLNARGKYRLFMDADNSTSIEEMRNMMPYFSKGYDVVIGSRGVKGADITSHQPWVRENMGKAFIYFMKLFTGLPFKDTQAGFKIFTGASAVDIFPMQTIRGWIFDVELLVIARELGYEVKELPITWKHHPDSSVSVLKGVLNALKDLVVISYGLKTKKYVSEPALAKKNSRSAQGSDSAT